MDTKTGQIDVAIIGGGPAGMSAALWCSELGLRSCLIDAASNFGGQLHWIHNPISNYPPEKFDNGSDVVHRFQTALADRDFVRILNSSVKSIDRESTSILIDDGQTISARAIVLATGVRRRKLGVPGEREFSGKGILESGSRDKSEAAGQRVAVIGGGDAALENALILAEYADKVYIVHRRGQFSARNEFVQAVKRHERIESILDVRVKEFGGSSNLEFLDVEQADSVASRIAIDKAVVRIGVEPNSEVLEDIAELDGSRYVKVDPNWRTSVPSIYAIGDVASPIAPTIATAVGSGAAAIKSIAIDMQRNK